MQVPHRSICESVFASLDDYLDRELTAVEMRTIAEHLGVCEQCAAEFEFEAKVLDAVRDKVARLQVPDDLLARVSAQLSDARIEPDERRDSR